MRAMQASKSLTTGGLVKTSITVDPAQLARLDQAARERTVHRSQLLRIAIHNLLIRLDTGDALYPELSERSAGDAA